MWAALTKTVAKDLWEFGNVLTNDTQRIVEGTEGSGSGDGSGAAAAGLVAGDEAAPEAAIFRLDVAVLARFQADVSTYAAPLNDAEEAEAARLDGKACDAAGLLKRNETVRDQYAYLVTQSPSTADDSVSHAKEEDSAEKKMKGAALDTRVDHEEFFRRYFTRLIRLRRSESRARKQRMEAADAEAASASGLSEWDASPPSTQGDGTVVSGGAGAAAHATAAGAEATAQIRAYEKKIADLERLVAALGSQVGHLQTENTRLQRELAALGAAGGEIQAPSCSAPATALSNAVPQQRQPVTAAADHAPHHGGGGGQIDDDDWASVS